MCSFRIIFVFQSPVITNTLKCLEAQSIDDAYTLSLVAYAYSLLGQNTAGVTGTMKAAFMQKLNDKAVASGRRICIHMLYIQL